MVRVPLQQGTWLGYARLLLIASCRLPLTALKVRLYLKLALLEPRTKGETLHAQRELRPQQGGERYWPKPKPQQTQDHSASNAVGQRHNCFYCCKFVR